ncbi:universal stress protein UspA [Halostagnicola larsenii XH-48]|uniref:Universal stress protein UspA n=1 Tax=Halostagnicola larsenii XH-48 TaxID=797299 RepID=W0JMB3_9EURY|nr:universal stress protein [Halostagnicola larsenii]AHF98441.1 universal stress protein UspA [Halostagnicola larsenii XH-48]
MSQPPANRPVLVAVGDPAHAEQLVRTAGDLARLEDGVVRIVSITVKPQSSPFSLYTDETIIEEYPGNSRQILERAIEVAPDDVTVESEVLVARSVVDGITTAVGESEARALVVGWRERRGRTNAVLGTTVDQLVERVPCDLYVERIGHEADGVDSILLPVAGGPHVGPAARVATAIAATNDATISVLSVAPVDRGSESAREYVAEAELALENAGDSTVRTESRIEEGSETTDVIVERAHEHDVLVFGTTRQSALHRRLVGSIPRAVVRQTEQTVILCRAGDAVEGPVLRQLRQFLMPS